MKRTTKELLERIERLLYELQQSNKRYRQHNEDGPQMRGSTQEGPIVHLREVTGKEE